MQSRMDYTEEKKEFPVDVIGSQPRAHQDGESEEGSQQADVNPGHGVVGKVGKEEGKKGTSISQRFKSAASGGFWSGGEEVISY